VQRGGGLFKQALAAQERGNLPAAYWLLREDYLARPEVTELAEAFWDVAVSYERHVDAVPAVVGLIAKFASAGHDELAAQYWVELVGLEPDALASPTALFRILPTLEQREAQETDEKDKERLALAFLQALRAIVAEGNEGLSPGIAIQVAEFARDLDTPSAVAAARTALTCDDLHEVKRARMVELLRELDPEGEIPEFVSPFPDTPPLITEPPEPEREAAAQSTRQCSAPQTAGHPSAQHHPARHHPLHDAIDDKGPGLSPEELAAVRLPPARTSLPVPEGTDDDDSPELGLDSLSGEFVALEEDGIDLEVEATGRTRVAYERIDAVTVARISEASGEPEIVIDLLLNWSVKNELPLRSVRLRVESLESCISGADPESPGLQARDALAEILDRSRALPVPDPDTALGLSVPAFESMEAYESQLLSQRRCDAPG